jgi:hypothetical protein
MVRFAVLSIEELGNILEGKVMSTTYKFKAFYKKAGIGTVPAAAPTVNVVDNLGNLLANGAVTTPRPNMPELFEYTYTGADNLDPVAKFITTDLTMDESQLASGSYCSYPAASAGAIAYTITVDTPGGLPIDGVNVWVSTDIAGVNVIFNGYTNALGIVIPMLDAGNYFAWKQKAGFTFVNPEAFAVP